MALRIPFLGRLHLREYFALVLSILLIALESVIAVITLALPTPIINACYRITRRLFNQLSSPSSRRSRDRKKDVWSAVANAGDFTELCEIYGYYCEEHIVQTGDGYLLGLHRLGWRRGEEGERVNAGPGKDGLKKKVVYLHHGLMMNSEVWVCLTERERCLPFELVERGYDVWLGNNRGNKYSKKNIHVAPTDAKFWNFSMDQFAFHDIPDSISYILETTHQPSLSYIGFSQGTAQAFATLSIHPTLNEKVDVFIALAPAMSPKGVASGTVDSFVKASPDILYLAFGRKAILASATMWQSILYPPIFVRLIDASLRFLFGWTAINISPDQKLASYPHLYSYTSTKSVVHWFQIIRNGVFQMYDDEAPSPINPNRSKYYKVAKFPTRNIKTPIVLVWGGSDSLVDINVMLKELPRHTIAKEIPHYEHLDFLWAQSVDKLVFPHVFEALDKHASSSTNLDLYKDKHLRSPVHFSRPLPESRALPEPENYNASDDSPIGTPPQSAKKISKITRRTILSDNEETEPSPRSRLAQITRIPHPRSSPRSSPHSHTAFPFTQSSPLQQRTPSQPNKPQSPSTSASKVVAVHTVGSPANSNENSQHSQLTGQTSTSRPEGWWSSDEVAGTEQEASHPITPSRPQGNRRRSFDSQASNGRVSRFGERGISLGSAKAVNGVVDGEGHGESGGSKASNRLSVGSVGSFASRKDGDRGSAEERKKKFKVKKRSGSGTPMPGSS
ncbi:Sterol esterase [Ascochyta rabiei]|uniref:Lipid metabolic process n=1 Tax=Didymella rabiei TaxID=5454 RepID=A0A163LUQ1_DIDRA|nr:Sterol esterase [Ascochyta rabiei]KZM28138.1 lipid metabolic process [Ascochyta rabiei]UPX10494.1 Sterol esterase [Ascochyta rabiei]